MPFMTMRDAGRSTFGRRRLPDENCVPPLVTDVPVREVILQRIAERLFLSFAVAQGCRRAVCR